MTNAPLPENEAERLQALYRCDLLDTPAEEAFDDFTRLAAIICGTPISLISLVDAERQWFKSKIGLDATETPRDQAFCAHVILDPTEVMVVPDATKDSRFATSSLVTSAPNIRFYAGAPLVTSDGCALGALCVIDDRPRDLSPQQVEALRALSRQAVAQIEMRLLLAERENTEKRLNQREEEITRDSELTERLLASLTSLLIGVDQAGSITRWNATAEKVFGIKAALVMGQPFRECGIQWDWTPLEEAIVECAETCQKVSIENLDYCDAQGEERLLGLTLNPFKGNEGKTAGFLLAGADVTERRRSERALKESEERLRLALQELEGRNWELAEARDVALAAARLKSQFLANTSHEVRTPLNGIMGMTHLLLGTSLDERQRKWLQTIKHSADALLTILNDILDFSKIEAGKMTIETADFSLRAVIEDSAALLAGKAQEKRIALRCLLSAPGAHPFAEALRGDPGRLRQVLINLLGNAIKFTDEGGSVTVGADLLMETAMQAQWKVWVQDTGIGIPPDKQASIFESFTQADGSTTRKYGGTGLGLTISRQLVMLMGGKMDLSSKPGQGSTFFLEITLDKSEGGEDALALSEAGDASAAQATASGDGIEEAPQNSGSHHPWETAQLLLAEDNPINQMVIMGMLAACGFRTESIVLTASGRECLNALQKADFDLILMDMQMPDMDGPETVKHIRAEDRETGRRPVPIVAMTAHCMTGDRERLLGQGMDDYLAKPIDFQQLQQCLARWLPATAEALSTPATAPPLLTEDAERPLLDERQLAGATGGNADLAQRLLATLIASAPKMLVRCALAQETEDGPGLEHWAHTLKGSCSTLGTWTLTPLCQKLENLGRQNSFGQAGLLLKQLEAEWERILRVIEARLAFSETASAASTASPPDTSSAISVGLSRSVSEPPQACAA